MLGIGGCLQSQSQPRLLAGKHMESVHRIHGGDPSSHTTDDAVDYDVPSSSKKRTRKNEEENKIPPKKLKQTTLLDAKSSTAWIPLADIIINAKEKMQGPEKLNGVTFAFMGSSGCGKSTVIRKVFIEQIFGREATRKRKDREFIIEIFTESAKSDAFKELSKDVLVDSKGLDEDNINWCYHMNENYDKRYNFFLMLDDVLDIKYKHLVLRMFLTMRNTNISSLVSLQYPNLIPKSVRTSVYFTMFFFFNNDEAVELCVRGWLSSYLPGKNIREKIMYYRNWVMEADGHCMFLMDNLNHKCYKVNNLYLCQEIKMLRSLDAVLEPPATPTSSSSSELTSPASSLI